MVTTCPGCGVDATVWMTTDALWRESGCGRGWWCIPCFAAKLGRPLVGEDLEPVPANIPHLMAHDTPGDAALKLAAVRGWSDGQWARCWGRQSGA